MERKATTRLITLNIHYTIVQYCMKSRNQQKLCLFLKTCQKLLATAIKSNESMIVLCTVEQASYLIALAT